ncbi:hypothetical protein ABID52_003888 [Fictibacillus halophilus]|uniref:Uncharacterized protein n=2 Tax=Fictibacillus TaxID=1329200 RepID=A0ABS2ZM05_9BACL|nr:hypothetical protein [Fictibacillus nanhaiensis]
MISKVDRWKKNYLYLFIVFYGAIGPISFYLFKQGYTSLFYGLVPIAVALPSVRRNHLGLLERKEESMKRIR